MIYNLPGRYGQDGRIEEGLKILKEQYRKPQMPLEQVEKLKKTMEEAGMEQVNGRVRAQIAKYAAAAALAAIFVALPNTSATIANAMNQIPVIGRLVEAVTFRNYEYGSDRNMADIKVPGLKLGRQMAGRRKKIWNARLMKSMQKYRKSQMG